MNTEHKLAIHFFKLSEKEIALFERVISFNVTHGLKADMVDEKNIADLIITTTEAFNVLDNNCKNKTTIVITNDENESQGDLQLCRPLMITKAMGALTESIKLSQTKQSGTTTETDSGLLDINIEDVDIDFSRAEIQTPIAEITEEVSIETNTHHALIIDDSAAIRKQLELELRDAGISSEFAESGEDALEIIKDKHFDLVFLDIIMPGIDGYETCKAMRADASYKKTPIIMLSGKTSPLDEVQGVIAGATTYLTKPVKSDKLQETLNRVTKWIENFAPPKQTESV